MSHKHQLKNPLYRNWVRGAMALKYLKQGLEVHIDQSIQTQHSAFIGSLPSSGATNIQCGQCTIEKVLPDHAGSRCIHKVRSKCLCCTKGRTKCPSSICSVFIDLVIKEHWLHDPIWCNIDLKTWPSYYWQVAKCFLSSPSRSNASSAKDTDVADLLSIAINDSYIRNNIKTIDNFIKARNVRNSIVHTANYELLDTELADNIQTFIDVLLDAVLIHDHAAQNAIKNLNQLRNDAIFISTEDVEEMRTYALRAIDERKEEVFKDIQNNAKHTLENITEEITKYTDRKLTDLSQKIDCEKNEMLQNFQEKVNADKGDIEQLKTDSIAVINERNEQIILKCEKADDKLNTAANELQEIKNENVQDFADQTNRIKDKILQEIDEHIEKQLTEHEVRGVAQENGSVIELRKAPENEQTAQSLICAGMFETTGKSGINEQGVELVFPIFNEAQYSGFKHDFQNDLVSHYRRHHDISTVSLTQFSRKYDAPLLQVFVLPNMTFRYYDGLQNRNSSPVKSYADILLHASIPVQNVFISGPTGTGKTVLARHLCLSWCHAHRPQKPDTKYFKVDDITAVKHFDFLFFVNFSNVPENQHDLYEVIKNQIVDKLPNAHIYCRNYFLHSVLSRERCLIIIDDLDKRLHPDPTSTHYETETKSLPHINRENITTLSITSQWKLGFWDLNFKQMDMKVEMVDCDQASFENMSRSTIAYLNAMVKDKKNAEGFLRVVHDLDIDNDSVTRICHMYLLGHWFEDRFPRTSRNILYDFLTKVLFSRKETSFSMNAVDAEYYSEISEMVSSICGLNEDKSLVRYKEPTQLYSYRKTLLKLGKLSFECLSSAKSDDVAIYHVNKFLSSDEIQYCLDIGVLSLNETRSLTSNTKSISFKDHEEFQAYFAGVYVSTFKSIATLKETIQRSYVRVRKRTVSAFLVFLAGLNPNLFAEISKCMYDSYHGTLQEYRNGFDVGSVIELRLRHFQNVMVKCVREMLRHRAGSPLVLPHLEDIFFDEACENTDYRCALNQLIAYNKDQIKSITIYFGQLSQEVLASVEISSIQSPQKLAVLKKCHGKNAQKGSQPVVDRCSNEALLDVIQSVVFDSGENLKCVSFEGIYLPPQKFKNIIDSQRFRFMSMNQVQISDVNVESQAGRISIKVGVPKSYMYLCGNMSYTVNDDLIRTMANLQTVKIQNTCFSPSQLNVLGTMDKVTILSLWHIQLARPAKQDTTHIFPNTFDISFDRQRISIAVRGKVPNVFLNAFLTNNSRDVKNIKVVFVYLTFQSLYSLCSIKRPNSMVLKGITLISEEEEPETSRYMDMRKTFKCELSSFDEKLSLCGSAPENVHRYLLTTYSESVKKIELRDVVLSESDLDVLAGIKDIHLFTFVNIMRRPVDKYQQITILNTFDMVYTKEEQKVYVCGDISETFFDRFIDANAEVLKNVDLRYVGQTTACLNSFTKLNELRELSLYFCRSDFEDTSTVVSLLNKASDSLQLVRLGCLSLLTKQLAVNNMQQTESMSIREIIHSSKTKASKRDQDFASADDNYCIQLDYTNTSLYIEGNTPDAYISNFLQKLQEHTSCTAVHLKRMSLSQSNLLKLDKVDHLKTLRLVDVTCQGENENDVDVLSIDGENSEIGDELFETDSFFDETEDDEEFSNREDIANLDEAVDLDNVPTDSGDNLSVIPDTEIDRNEADNMEVDTDDQEHFDYRNGNDAELFSQDRNEQNPLNIQFDHFEERLFASGEITDPVLFKLLLSFCKLSKEVKLVNVKLRHLRAKEIFSCIDKNTDIELIEIEGVKCYDHENCNRLAMDLSKLVHLRSLALKSTHLTDVKVNGEHLHTCKVDSLVVPGIVTSLLENLHPKVIDTLELISIRGGTDIDTMTKVIPTLKGLKSLEICWVNIYDKNFNLFPHLKQLDRLILRNVTMTFEAFLRIITNAGKVKKDVRVRFYNCKLAEESDTQVCRLKEFITQTNGCKTEEEWTYENGHFSGIYVI
ncbi:uncharacterized protein LOC123551526 [Mercenaria mercenaria]|uniref:uncharacterized protein LOC123551526 n=1 Tax=Mercenaria mercenaria TaxID=6596 RepID=UPI00234F26E8|nr:uncharacterized protein LOC123551526 [Mercenaria mercenaria]